MKLVCSLLLISTAISSLFSQEVNTIIDSRDGQEYQIVKIGEQWWMAENLKATKYSDSTAIPRVDGTSGWVALGYADKAYCYYDNSTTNGDIYGALYTWAAAMNGAATSNMNPSGIQGVCPTGWHIPSITEFAELANYVNDIGDPSISGGLLKETGTSHWVGPNQGATNSTGFTALPSGNRDPSGGFGRLGRNAYFFSSSQSESDSIQAWILFLGYDFSTLILKTHGIEYGVPVRCVKDPLLLDKTVKNIKCKGNVDGQINISITGAFPPYSILWSNNDTTEIISGLTPGYYMVVIKDQ